MRIEDKLDAQIARNSRVFAELVGNINPHGALGDELRKVQRAASFASFLHTGLYFSKELENLAKELSFQIDFGSLEKIPKKSSTLHVLSEAYETGGHTRVVERWIEASNFNQPNSVLFTRKSKVPKRLKAAVDASGGRLYTLTDKNSSVLQVLELRRVANLHSRVILHIHMDDILPLLAFGQGDYSGELNFYNHADHQFWVGASLPCKFLEVRSWGKALSFSRRSIEDSRVLGIPMSSDLTPSTLVTQKSAKAELGIPNSSKVMLTVGNSLKYIGLGEWNFPSVVESLLSENMDRHLIAVGPRTRDNLGWRRLQQLFPKQVRLLPELKPQTLRKLYMAADVGLDSFPMSGGTVSLDMMSAGLPFVSVKNPVGQTDFVVQSGLYEENFLDWRDKISRVLSDNSGSFRAEAREIFEIASRKFGPSSWSGLMDLASDSEPIFDVSTPSLGDMRWVDRYLAATVSSKAFLYFKLSAISGAIASFVRD
jgi:hypothetical protein